MTSDSKHKIIDLYDATGAGNVDISTELRPDSDRYLIGLTGRKLKVNTFCILLPDVKYIKKKIVHNKGA